MNTEILFYKDHTISGDNAEIIFHKDYPYLFNETDSFPIVKFSLIDCKNLAEIDFVDIDYYNDGISIEINEVNEQTIFNLIDVGNIETIILCDKVLREDLEYRQSDLINIIKSVKKESFENYKIIETSNSRLDALKKLLTRDLDIIQRKLKQADWLTGNKKQFLEGQQNVIYQVLQFIDEKKIEDL